MMEFEVPGEILQVCVLTEGLSDHNDFRNCENCVGRFKNILVCYCYRRV